MIALMTGLAMRKMINFVMNLSILFIIFFITGVHTRTFILSSVIRVIYPTSQSGWSVDSENRNRLPK